MKLKVMVLLKFAWLIACLVVPIWTFVACGHETNATLSGECLLFATIIMAVLTVPSGILWWLLLSSAAYTLPLIGIEIRGMSEFAGFFVWIGFVVIGYLQWFKLVPWLIMKWRSWRAAKLQT